MHLYRSALQHRNEAWVYNDNVNSPEIRAWLGSVVGKEAEDLSRHDKWLCMMYPRLRLLKEFLRDDGSIWISIDDNEFPSLRLLCDEIFGRKNFIATVIWHKMDTRKTARSILARIMNISRFTREMRQLGDRRVFQEAMK